MIKAAIGELIGTFILVFIGCGTVGMNVVYGFFPELWQIALMWGGGVALAIYLVRPICPAHLNPAVSVGMRIMNGISSKEMIVFIIFQFLGAFIAGESLFCLFSEGITNYEIEQNMLRNSEQGREVAKMFGEFFSVSHLEAIFFEGIGTFCLMTIILLTSLVPKKRASYNPVLIGLGLALLIVWIAPFTQAGFNPARDFGPRIVAFLNGWEWIAFDPTPIKSLLVYILAPIVGAAISVLIWIQLKLKR